MQKKVRLEKRVPKYFTYKQAAEILNIPVCEVRELEAAGELVPKRFITRTRFSERDIVDFINKHRES